MASGQTVIVNGFDSDSDDKTVILQQSTQSQETTPQTALVVPLKLREQVIGTITLYEARHQRPWLEEEIALAEAVAEQAALTVETLRLMDETQRRAARERLVGEIAGQVRSSLDPDTILKTTVRELGRALGAEQTSVEMIAPSERRQGDGRMPGEDLAREKAASRRGRRHYGEE